MCIPDSREATQHMHVCRPYFGAIFLLGCFWLFILQISRVFCIPNLNSWPTIYVASTFSPWIIFIFKNNNMFYCSEVTLFKFVASGVCFWLKKSFATVIVGVLCLLKDSPLRHRCCGPCWGDGLTLLRAGSSARFAAESVPSGFVSSAMPMATLV